MAWSRNSIVELGGKFLINPGSVTGACSELGICVVSHERDDITVSMVGLCSTKAMQWESLTSRDSLNASELIEKTQPTEANSSELSKVSPART